METTKRFDNAALKLYNAFNEGRLNSMDCGSCAVGNIVGHGNWLMNRYSSPGVKLSIYYSPPIYKDYSEEELFEVERLFLVNTRPDETKETQYNGLIAVLEYLASLDNIELPKIIIDKFERVLA